MSLPLRDGAPNRPDPDAPVSIASSRWGSEDDHDGVLTPSLQSPMPSTSSETATPPNSVQFVPPRPLTFQSATQSLGFHLDCVHTLCRLVIGDGDEDGLDLTDEERRSMATQLRLGVGFLQLSLVGVQVIRRPRISSGEVDAQDDTQPSDSMAPMLPPIPRTPALVVSFTNSLPKEDPSQVREFLDKYYAPQTREGIEASVNAGEAAVAARAPSQLEVPAGPSQAA